MSNESFNESIAYEFAAQALRGYSGDVSMQQTMADRIADACMDAYKRGIDDGRMGVSDGNRTIDDIREDIVKASRDYDVVLKALDYSSYDPNIGPDDDPYGWEEVIDVMRKTLYGLYKELADRIKGGEI